MKDSALKNSFVFFILFLSPLAYGKSYVTYSGSGGRLGDNLTSFLHAAYVAHFYELELLYNHFDYFDQLSLSSMYRHLNDAQGLYVTVKAFSNYDIFKITQEDNMLYIIPYFPSGDYDRTHCGCFQFECNWNDKTFLDNIRTAVKLKNPFPAPSLNENTINIALHIRRGGGADSPLYNKLPSPHAYLDVGYPMKCPPLTYYIQQLQKIIHLFQPAAIHVHLFTDDTNPLELISRIKSEITYNNITYDCRSEGNYHNRNVLEDLFAMPCFDILLRGDSNYAIVADRLNDYLLVISPVDYTWQDEKLIITKQKIRLNSAHKKYGQLTLDTAWLTNNFAKVENIHF